jgi:hypothetical protein
VVNSLPRREAFGQQTPSGSTFENIQDRVMIARRSVGGRPRLLGLGSIGLKYSHCASVISVSKKAFFIAPTAAAPKMENKMPTQ